MVRLPSAPAAHVDLPPNITLIGSPICPFVARARIVAWEKGIDLPVTFIDLVDKPMWFLTRSPTGTVPALEYGDKFIFESSVISEFLNELTPENMHPEPLVDRALNRSWIEFAGTILRHQYMMLVSSGMIEARQHQANLQSALGRIEQTVSSTPFFNGAHFAIIDAAYAPVFARCAFLVEHHNLDLLQGLPRLRDWGDAIITRPSVRSVHDERHQILLSQHLAQRRSVFAPPQDLM